MFMLGRSFFGCVVLLFLVAAVHAGTTTAVTYYPYPSGKYNDLTMKNVGIGIGTATRHNRLVVGGSLDGRVLFGPIDFGGPGGLVGISFGGTLDGFRGSLSGSAGEDLYFDTPAGYGFHFQQNTVTQAALDSAGNVGIGIGPGLQKLEVSGTFKADTADFVGGTAVLDNNGIVLTTGNVTLQPGDVFVQSGSLTVDTGDIYVTSGSITTNTGSVRGNTLAAVTVTLVNRDMKLFGPSLDFLSMINVSPFFSSTSMGSNVVVDQMATADSAEMRSSSVLAWAGEVCIACAGTPAADKLDVRGNMNVQNLTANDITALAYYISSDRALKANILPLKGALAKALRLQGVSFVFKTEPDQRRIGLIAQDVEPVVPEAVITMKDGLKAIDYPALITLLITAIQEQQVELDQLRVELKRLQLSLASPKPSV